VRPAGRAMRLLLLMRVLLEQYPGQLALMPLLTCCRAVPRLFSHTMRRSCRAHAPGQAQYSRLLRAWYSWQASLTWSAHSTHSPSTGLCCSQFGCHIAPLPTPPASPAAPLQRAREQPSRKVTRKAIPSPATRLSALSDQARQRPPTDTATWAAHRRTLRSQPCSRHALQSAQRLSAAPTPTSILACPPPEIRLSASLCPAARARSSPLRASALSRFSVLALCTFAASVPHSRCLGLMQRSSVQR
jgi:hypothetical protein